MLILYRAELFNLLNTAFNIKETFLIGDVEHDNKSLGLFVLRDSDDPRHAIKSLSIPNLDFVLSFIYFKYLEKAKNTYGGLTGILLKLSCC